MKILGIEHVAIATRGIDLAAPFWEVALGIERTATESVPAEGVTTAILDTGRGKIELLEESRPQSPITKFLDKRGVGLHHISLLVEDLDLAIEELKGKGIRFTADSPSRGAEGFRVIFVHPSSAGGVLVELCGR